MRMSKSLSHLDSNSRKPNWVSSVTTDKSHYLAPLPYRGDRRTSLQRLKSVIAPMSGAQLLTEEGETYLHYTFTTLILRFVDDVEFYADDKRQEIHFKSASRVGHSDLGANRKRMLAITAAYLAK
jgi:uncharacterized protein (DUF1499 family)